MSFLNVNQVNTAGNLPSFTTGANTINFNGSVIGGSSASTMKNRIINGAMVINQYNANSSVAIASDGQYFIDRFQGKTTQASKYNAQMMTPFTSGYVTPPAGFTNYLALTVASAYSVVSTDYFYINQRIEGYNITDWAWGTANAKPITISFWVYSNVTGTFGGCLQNIDASYTYPFTYNISNPNTWQYITVTITPPTAGGWNNNNGIGLVVCISLGVGSNYSATPFVWGSGLSSRSATGAVSIMGSTSNYLYLTGLQVEVGSSATSFDFRHYQQELALCQRYAYVYNNSGLSDQANFYSPYTPAQITAGLPNSSAILPFYLPVIMRVAPTQSSIVAVNVTINRSTATTNQIVFQAASTSTGTAYLTSFIASAEL
jgi:hypothetical protein